MRFLLLNQCFHPDVVSTSQHLTDLARALVERGHDVTVIASRRGYDDLTLKFQQRERWNGIEIIRIPSLALGKSSKLYRALNFASFLIACCARLTLIPRPDVVVALTSPPLISFVGSVYARVRGARFVFWVMDLNPDEAVAAGWLRTGSLVERFLSRLLRYSLRHASRIVTLDRFMRARVVEKGIDKAKTLTIPPWSHDDDVRFDAEGGRVFRRQHGLDEKFVVMYSGNHSPCHPLDTLLGASLRLRDNSDITFCFVGGGSEFTRVKGFANRNASENIVCLPYQPLDQLGASLSAADLHVVVMGDGFRGIVHPCKIYNVLQIGSALLYVGPTESHIADIINDLDPSFVVTARHGEVDRTVEGILRIAALPRGQRSERAVAAGLRFRKAPLVERMVSDLESIDASRLSIATEERPRVESC